MDSLSKTSVIGLPVTVATYESALSHSLELALLNRSAAVSLANTHIASASRSSLSFEKVMTAFDMILPDGMPLIWIMNAKLKRLKLETLKDRVYGPYFMKYALEHAPKETSHYLFGGTEECLDELQAAMRRLRPDIKIAGSLSPPYRAWTDEDQCNFSKSINDADPEFIWVALGGEKQERWIIENMHRVNRGVFFAIGDAFELLAGRRPFAPNWCQRHGVTWLYRLMQEPSRMWKRYFKYNTLFVIYLIRDLMSGKPSKS